MFSWHHTPNHRRSHRSQTASHQASRHRTHEREIPDKDVYTNIEGEAFILQRPESRRQPGADPLNPCIWPEDNEIYNDIDYDMPMRPPLRRRDTVVVLLPRLEIAIGSDRAEETARFIIDRGVLRTYLPRSTAAVREGVLDLEHFFHPDVVMAHPSLILYRALRHVFHHLEELSRTGGMDMFGAPEQQLEAGPNWRIVQQWGVTMQAMFVVLDNERGLGCSSELLRPIMRFLEGLFQDIHNFFGSLPTTVLFEAFGNIFRAADSDILDRLCRIWDRFDTSVQNDLVRSMRDAIAIEGIGSNADYATMESKSSKSSKPSKPSRPSEPSKQLALRAVDPQPIRNPSPSNPYPEYNPQNYKPQEYNQQNYDTQNQNYNPQSYNSQPYVPQSYTPQPYGPENYPGSFVAPGPASGPAPGLPPRPASQSQMLPERPGAMIDSYAQGAALTPMMTSTEFRDTETLKTNCQFALRELLSLQRQRQRYDATPSSADLESRIHSQAGVLLGDLRILQGEVRSLAKEAENHRWRRWIIGGAIATFIPLIRRFFHRSDDEESQLSSNDTEYAFKRSQGLLSHIKDSVLGKGRFAKMAFLVFAVLYVFSNEVSLRVARTTQKRIKKLCARIERGDSDIDEKDMKTLEGWRWRVLLCLQDTQAADDRRFAELFSTPPDFKQFAKIDPDFEKAYTNNKKHFFNDPKGVMQLTKTLLQQNFDLKIELPDDRLCPPVPNRHNYILWLKGLLDTSSYDDPSRKFVGLDIGTGASCIYPLLGCAQRPWSFIATDIDEKNIEFAKQNVKLNNLDDRIRIILRSPEELLIPLYHHGIQTIDFTMTNPPFYESEAELIKSAKEKARPPFTACTGAKVEMVTSGGEAGFVNRILLESLVLRERVQWYTSMFGFQASLISFAEKLQHHGIDNYAITEFIQGNITRRWAVAWSFGPMRPAQKFSRNVGGSLPRSILPAITEVDVIKVPMPQSIGAFAEKLNDAISKLELMSWTWDPQRLEGSGRAVDKVWGRAWRRRKQRNMDIQENEGDQKKGPECCCGFKVTLRIGRDGVTVGCRWLEGHDAVAFESFQGFLKATVQSI
ncbi:hypothetical protein G7046_g4898 [Stylonectria norvegica]|nr:hypothetical protein G7046_g4898 [Stylonectria norvegica]